MAKTALMATAISRGSFFDPRPFLARAGYPGSLSKYRTDQIVFSPDDPADAVFYIERGVVRIAAHSRRGKKAIVALLGTGDFFGEEALAGRSRRAATADAMTDCAISRVELPALLHVLREEPKFSELFLAYLTTRKAEIEEDLVDQLLHSTEKRLARRLLLLADPGRQRRSKHATASISQETIAAMVGTTQSRVSFFMNKFRRVGLIDYNGELTINRLQLSAFLNE